MIIYYLFYISYIYTIIIISIIIFICVYLMSVGVVLGVLLGYCEVCWGVRRSMLIDFHPTHHGEEENTTLC